MKKWLGLSMVFSLVLGLSGIAMASDSNTLTVSATVQGTCRFSSTSATLDFGALDPANPATVNASNTTQFWCTKGVIEVISADNGLNWSGSLRQMAGPGGDLIPYSLALTPDGGSNQGPTLPRILTISGSVSGTDYESKTAGSYSDTVVLTIQP